MKLFSSLAFASFARLATLFPVGAFGSLCAFGSRGLRGVLFCLLASCLFEQADAQQADAKQADDSLSVLRIQGGDTYRGKLAPSQNPQQLLWNCPSFLEPIAFPWDALQLVQVQDSSGEPTESSPLGKNPFCAELKTGQVVSGELVSIQPDRIELEVPQVGKVSLATENLRYLLRIIPGGSQAVEVLSAQDWEQVLPATRNGRATKWYLKAGEISTDTSGTTISQWAQLPELATIDLDVAWDQASPNWWMTLGEPRRMELQVRKLQNKKLLNVTLLLENSADADVTTIQLPYEEDQSIKLRLLCDATKGVYVLMKDNQVLGRLKGNIKERFVGRTKVSFTNTALGVLTLRDLRISRNAFSIPSEAAEVEPNRPANGQFEWMTKARGTFFGSILNAPADNDGQGSVKVQGIAQTPITLGFEEIERIEFPLETALPNQVTTVELTNGMRFASSAIQSRTEASFEGIDIDVAGKKLPVTLSQIKRISKRPLPILEDPQPKTIAEAQKIVVQRLITDDAVSTGRIASVSQHTPGSKTFTWLAKNAVAPVALNPRADGAIEPLVTQLAGSTQKRTKPTENLANVRTDTPPNENDVGRPLKPEDPSLFLFSGDCFPAMVRRGDAEEFFFESTLFPKQSIEQALVRGVRFVDYRGVDKIDRATRLRLLTLPRVQRNNPPSHLVVSRDGDLLRGKLIHFDRDQLVVDVRGEQRTILVKNIAELIALDPAPKLEQPNDPTESTQPTEPTQPTDPAQSADSAEPQVPAPIASNDVYQIILEQGARVSIVPESVDSEELKGTHPQLGECSLPWSSVVRISLGDAIAVDASQNRYGKWKLQHAPDPKFVSESEGGNDRPNDTPQMRMIGQGAPEFDLMKIDGTPFKLKENRGKILIVDFWATWCGPCIRSIPSLIEISKEYKEAGVELVLVNCEEPETRVRPFLERLKSIPTVVLDTDGTVSKQYNVAAIPQTVLIDRDGGIVEVLVGASDENEEILRKKIETLIKQ
ncbi:MAG: TlpA family protein disulfide reductase [Pirellula sp.]|nr:TlpA family protein disulfide reductase [Pirellula sp.]